MSTLIILRLEAKYGEKERAILFENLLPNSPYAISPLRMKFEEETTGTMSAFFTFSFFLCTIFNTYLMLHFL